mmetsp:Transcript_45953/g.107827  ORF Transcript_45953/g.107827 Transcript_45953/m.107827 type:complete len:220 (-) Transcript_45953:822-1481(-)
MTHSTRIPAGLSRLWRWRSVPGYGAKIPNSDTHTPLFLTRSCRTRTDCLEHKRRRPGPACLLVGSVAQGSVSNRAGGAACSLVLLIPITTPKNIRHAASYSPARRISSPVAIFAAILGFAATLTTSLVSSSMSTASVRAASRTMLMAFSTHAFSSAVMSHSSSVAFSMYFLSSLIAPATSPASMSSSACTSIDSSSTRSRTFLMQHSSGQFSISTADAW